MNILKNKILKKAHQKWCAFLFIVIFIIFANFATFTLQKSYNKYGK
nr:MAG TPA: chitin synthase regulator [Caudoviricetes sp.]